MSEILRKFLEYVGFNDYEIENMDDVEIHFHSESREFKYFSDGYEQGVIETARTQSSVITSFRADLEQARKENAELKEKYKALELNTETRIKGCNDEIYRLKAQLEKMKCCGNCMYFTGDKCTYAYRDVNYNDNCETWELAE